MLSKKISLKERLIVSLHNYNNKKLSFSRKLLTYKTQNKLLQNVKANSRLRMASCKNNYNF